MCSSLQRMKFKIVKGSNQVSLEQKISECTDKLDKKGFYLTNIDLVVSENCLFAPMIFELKDFSKVIFNKVSPSKVSIVSEPTSGKDTMKLEEKINDLIIEKQKEHYYLTNCKMQLNNDTLFCVLLFEFSNLKVSI